MPSDASHSAIADTGHLRSIVQHKNFPDIHDKSAPRKARRCGAEDDARQPKPRTGARNRVQESSGTTQHGPTPKPASATKNKPRRLSEPARAHHPTEPKSDRAHRANVRASSASRSL